jgi:hypothetical protein
LEINFCNLTVGFQCDSRSLVAEMSDLSASVTFESASDGDKINRCDGTLFHANAQQFCSRFDVREADENLLVHSAWPGHRVIDVAKAIGRTNHKQAPFGTVVHCEKFVDSLS